MSKKNKQKEKNYTFNFPIPMMTEMAMLAKADGRSLTNYIEQMFIKHLEEKGVI